MNRVRSYRFAILCIFGLVVADPAFAKIKNYTGGSAAKFVRKTGECPLLVPSWRKGTVAKLKTPKIKYVYKGFLSDESGLKVGSQIFWESWKQADAGGVYRGVFEFCDQRFSRKKPQSLEAREKTLSKFEGRKSVYKSTGPLERAYLKTIRPTPAEKVSLGLAQTGVGTALFGPLLLFAVSEGIPSANVTASHYIATVGAGVGMMGTGIVTGHLGMKKRHEKSPLIGKVRKMYANVKAMEKNDRSMGKRCIADAESLFSSRADFQAAKKGCDAAAGSQGGSYRPLGSYTWRSEGDSGSLKKAYKKMKHYASILDAEEACKRADWKSTSSCIELSEFWKNNRGQAKRFRLMTESEVASTLVRLAKKEASRKQREADRKRRSEEDEAFRRLFGGSEAGSGTGTSRNRQCATSTPSSPMDPVPSGYYRQYAEHRKLIKLQMGKDIKSHCPSSYRCTDSGGNCGDVPLHHWGVKHSFVECFYVHDHLIRSR